MIAQSGKFSFQRNMAEKNMSNKTIKQKDLTPSEADKNHTTDINALALRVKSLEETLSKSQAENKILQEKVSTIPRMTIGTKMLRS